ncbi:MAG TPA: enoyl-CoA hydratase-related protein [Solirubrobacteraceae bacterium]|nr:enoyl-CoA hydratase-related protein [Solirubrobacteraceae bacterium]
MSPYRESAPLTTDWKNFEFDLGDGVATVTFNRPDKLNALTFGTYADLRDLITELLTPKMHELLEFTRMTGAVVTAMREIPIPVIAAVNGTAAGAGTVIALAADFRLLSDTATFAFLFTRVGLAGADMGAADLLPRIVGLGPATELLMLGNRIDAQTAREIGLATEVVPHDDLHTAAAGLAQRLADGPAFAYATTKSLLTRELDMDLGAAIELEAITQSLLMHSDDFKEFYDAWHEGRRPNWSGT